MVADPTACAEEGLRKHQRLAPGTHATAHNSCNAPLLPTLQLQPQRGQVCMCSRPALPPSAPVDQPQHTVPFCLSCAQGEAEGLQPNEGVFAALIEHMCMQQDLEAAAATLQLMKVKRGVGGGELARQAGRQAGRHRAQTSRG